MADGGSMLRTNLKILATVLFTVGLYTGIANVIPQVESEVPERVEIGSDVTTEELVGIGEEIYQGAGGCEACHGLGTRAPTLMGEIGRRCSERVSDMSCKQYLHESLVDPGAFVVEGFQPIMPNVEAQLSGGQVWALVAFLQSQGGEVTVGPADLEAAGGGSSTTAGGGGAGGGAAAEPGSAEALFRQYGCLACHQVGGQGGRAAPAVEAIRGRDLSADYLRRSILSPNADTASGYDQDWSALAGTMPTNFGERLTDEELQTLVDYLSGTGSP